MAMTASAVAGTNAGSPRASRPAFVGVAPSTSFAGSMSSTSARPRAASANGWAMTMPATAGSLFHLTRSVSGRSAVSSIDATAGSIPTDRAARSRLAT
jgi:hypothetical protein